MAKPGTGSTPLRVAIIGSGPAAFYAAEHLFKQPDLSVAIDMFDRVPTPFGLVRGGVAPDHAKIKTVTRIYHQIASNPTFRFYGDVELGKHLTLADLKSHYHMILYATGAQTDRRMGIPGEDLKGSHPATEFVAWYNGHPDYSHLQYDLKQERAAVIGIGNVAIDVARMLCRTREELVKTDVADYALEALANSNIKEVYLMGRRGPAQAAFTNPEVKEVGEMLGAEAVSLPDETELDPGSMEDAEKDPQIRKKCEILRGYCVRKAEGGKPKTLHMRFLVSPVELIGNGDGQIVKMKIVKNVLQRDKTGTMRPKATDKFEELPVGLVFRSVGYLGVALPDVPFDDWHGVIPNDKGRVVNPETKEPRTGEYCTGWIKRGPSGVIGTNKPDSVETIVSLLEDQARGVCLDPAHPDPESIDRLVRERQPNFFSYQDWVKLDEMEVARGKAAGRPRVKFTTRDEMLKALGRLS